MNRDDETRIVYDRRYTGANYYWGVRPSDACLEVLRRLPPDRPLKLLDVGCGEGRNAVFFARNGYHVHAFDISERGVEKTKELAEKAGVSIIAFQADLNAFRLQEPFDVVFSTGVLHCVDPALRTELIENYQAYTNEGGLHVLSVFVKKPFVAPAPDRDPNANPWLSGELFTLYANWRIEWCTEELFDCMSGGTPHQHAVNRIIARRVVI